MTGRLCRVIAVSIIPILVLYLYVRSSHKTDTGSSKADAIVLLAGAYTERAPAAAELYRHGCAPKIILANDGVLSSWSPQYDKNMYNIELAEEVLVKGGVPRAAIIKLPFYGSGTIFDALATREIAVRDGFKSLLLVTSDYHAFRCRYVFKYVLRNKGIRLTLHPVKSGTIYLRNYLLEGVKLVYYTVRYVLFRNFGTKLNGFEI